MHMSVASKKHASILHRRIGGRASRGGARVCAKGLDNCDRRGGKRTLCVIEVATTCVGAHEREPEELHYYPPVDRLVGHLVT